MNSSVWAMHGASLPSITLTPHFHQVKVLDAPAPPARAEIPCCYGSTGFQPISLIFPTEGCWEITGRAGNAKLTFVTLVVKVPFKSLEANWLPEGLKEQDRDIEALPKSLRRVFHFAPGTNRTLIIETMQGVPEIPTIYPAVVKESVRVNNQPGICVQGKFDVQQKWQSNADAGTLEWSAGALIYRITQTGLSLTCQDLVRMATPS